MPAEIWQRRILTPIIIREERTRRRTSSGSQHDTEDSHNDSNADALNQYEHAYRPQEGDRHDPDDLPETAQDLAVRATGTVNFQAEIGFPKPQTWPLRWPTNTQNPRGYQGEPDKNEEARGRRGRAGSCLREMEPREDMNATFKGMENAEGTAMIPTNNQKLARSIGKMCDPAIRPGSEA